MYYYIFSILSIHKCSIHNAYSQGLYTRSFCVVLCWIGLDWIGVSLIVCGLFFPFCLFAVSTFCHFCYLAIFPSCSLSRAFSFFCFCFCFCFCFLDRLQITDYTLQNRVWASQGWLDSTRSPCIHCHAFFSLPDPLAYQVLIIPLIQIPEKTRKNQSSSYVFFFC